MIDNLSVGMTGERSVEVGEEHTAAKWGSGELAVLATPCMVALMEGAAVAAVDALLPAGYCTVGSRLDVRHLAATAVGHPVQARAELVEIDGRRLVFRVEASDDAGLIGDGSHERFIVDLLRFMHKAAARGEA
jgi:fluoroacetyl-CoA thioesterase